MKNQSLGIVCSCPSGGKAAIFLMGISALASLGLLIVHVYRTKRGI